MARTLSLALLLAVVLVSCYKESVIDGRPPVSNTPGDPVTPPLPPGPPTPPPLPTVTDPSGYTYSYVQIGSQYWMTSNLYTVRYQYQQQSVTEVLDSANWYNYTLAAMCKYNNSGANMNTYGRLYNGYAARDHRNLCPTGWRVANSSDWAQLIEFCGGASVAGGKLKLEGGQWTAPNTGANNTLGFSARPSGSRTSVPVDYSGRSFSTSFWASTGQSGNMDQIITIKHDSEAVFVETVNRRRGACIRCVRI